jgi:murein DD-endopeptidase MepM/ murein hydrolase activator NlpD
MIHRLLAIMIVLLVFTSPAISAAQDVPQGITIHVVQRGENLFRIALRYGSTVDALAALNGITNPGNIQVGQRLLVPTGMDMPQAASPVEPVTATEPITALPSSGEIHIVAAGETLFRIATRYGLTVSTLAQVNGIDDPTVIYPGQQLIIPGGEPAAALFDLPPIVSAFDITPQILVEGQTTRIRLMTTVSAQLNGIFLGRAVAPISEANGMQHTLFIGVPMFTEAGTYPLSLTLTDPTGLVTALTVNLPIAVGSYGSETITLLADRSGLLDETVENAEQALIQTIMDKFTPTRYFESAISLPAAAAMTSPFGRRRSYNGGPFNRFHSGTDFAGVPGTPILAAASGMVVLADLLNVRGYATIIDHGWGIYTGYWHQNEIYVSVGDFVNIGQVIGTIGATGRVTGAHLHWELWVNGVPVNPMQWVSQPFL